MVNSFNQCNKSTALDNFKIKLLPNSSYHDYNTRNKALRRKQTVWLCQFDNSFWYKGINVLRISHDIINYAVSILSFKRYLKGFILSNVV